MGKTGDAVAAMGREAAGIDSQKNVIRRELGSLPAQSGFVMNCAGDQPYRSIIMKVKRTFSMVLAGMGTIAIVFPEKAALAYRGESCWWGSGEGFMGGWGMAWFGPLFMMLFWGFLIAGDEKHLKSHPLYLWFE